MKTEIIKTALEKSKEMNIKMQTTKTKNRFDFDIVAEESLSKDTKLNENITCNKIDLTV